MSNYDREKKIRKKCSCVAVLLGLPDPDPLGRDADPDPSLSEIMLEKQDFNSKF
jgi:hypothetical protein